MYCVKVLYPNSLGSTFNLKHYLQVHVPLGLGLLKKHCNVVPIRIEAAANPYTLIEGTRPPYHMIFSAYFTNKAEADSFKKLFRVEEAVRLQKEDWPNFSQADPEILITEIIEVDPATQRPK
jgi:hypothetical protein